MRCKFAIACICCIASTLLFNVRAQTFGDTSECSGLLLRTAVFCPEAGGLQIWTGIFNYHTSNTSIDYISDLNGNIYEMNEELPHSNNMGVIIHSTNNGSNCIDTVKITVANPPQASITVFPPSSVCRNTIINEPQFDTQYVDNLSWDKISASSGSSPVPISFPLNVTEDMTIRLAYANTVCGTGKHINISINVADTAPIPDWKVKDFPDITNVCQTCYFSLPQSEDLKVDSGVILSASVTWDIPDSPADQNITRYGKAEITLRGDSNICGYRSVKTEKNIKINIYTIDCSPTFIFEDNDGKIMPVNVKDTIICSCEEFYFGVRTPNRNLCTYAETDITKTVTPAPLNPIENISPIGDYKFKVTDNFKAHLKVNATLTCTGSISHPTVKKTVEDSIQIIIDDKDCPVPEDYYYCKGDTGYIFFAHTSEKRVDSVRFFPPHDTAFIKDVLRTEYNNYTVYKTTQAIFDSAYIINYWHKVRYTVHYYLNECKDTASYDSIAYLRTHILCEPVITVCLNSTDEYSCSIDFDTVENKNVRYCSGSPIYISVDEFSRAVVIDSFAIKDSAAFYSIEFVKDTCISGYYNRYGHSYLYGCDISRNIQYTLRAYTNNKQDMARLNIPVTVYWHDTINGIDEQQSKSSVIIHSVMSCAPTNLPYCPQCVGEKANIATLTFTNPNTDINKVEASFDSTTPLTDIIVSSRSTLSETSKYLTITSVQFADSVSYKADINYNVNDSIRYKQFSFTCNTDNCAPSFMPSKDTMCSGDSISIKIVNNNLWQEQGVKIHHIVWDSAVRSQFDSIILKPTRRVNGVLEKEYVLFHANIYAENPFVICDIYLSVPTVFSGSSGSSGRDTLISYRDTLNLFIHPEPNAFIYDTVYACQNDTIDLHDYEDGALIAQTPTYYSLGGRESTFIIHDPVSIPVDAQCKFHCDWMIKGSNMFYDSVFIYVDMPFAIAPKPDEYACVDSVVELSIESSKGGRFVTWVLNGTDTIAKNISVQRTIFDTVADVSKQYTVIVSNSCSVDARSFSLLPYPSPEIVMPLSIEACMGSAVKVVPDSCKNCSTFLWVFSGDSSTAREITVALDTNSVPEYAFITAFSEYGCPESDSVLVSPLPFAPVQIWMGDGAVASVGASDSVDLCLNGDTSFFASFTIDAGYATDVVSGWEHPLSSAVSVSGISGVSGELLTISNANNQAQGWYIYKTDLKGCVSSDSVFVSILPLPRVSISGNDFVCNGDTIFLFGTSPDADYMQWRTGSLDSLPVFEAGKYILDAYLKGCVNTANFNVSLRQKPDFSIGQDTSICEEEIVVLLAPFDVYNDFYWQDGSREKTYTVSITGEYSVTAVKDNCYNTEYVFVEVLNCGVLLFPTAFTPNGDNLNDCFMPITSTEKENLVYELLIYNRLGEQVFRTTNPEECWDGTFRGKPADPAVYVYRCIANSIYPFKNFSSSGTVTLVK